VSRPGRTRSPLWRCLFAHFCDFVQEYPAKYEKKYGLLKPIVEEVVNQYIDCGDLTRGFARVRCDTCKQEYLLAFSCRGRWSCPSWHQKKVLLFGEFIAQTIAYPVPHRQYVFSIPMRSRSADGEGPSRNEALGAAGLVRPARKAPPAPAHTARGGS